MHPQFLCTLHTGLLYPCIVRILISPSKIWAKKCALHMAKHGSAILLSTLIKKGHLCSDQCSSVWLSIVPQSKRSLVRIPVRACTWVVGQSLVEVCVRGNQLMFLSLPSPLSKNKQSLKNKRSSLVSYRHNFTLDLLGFRVNTQLQVSLSYP